MIDESRLAERVTVLRIEFSFNPHLEFIIFQKMDCFVYSFIIECFEWIQF